MIVIFILNSLLNVVLGNFIYLGLGYYDFNFWVKDNFLGNRVIINLF